MASVLDRRSFLGASAAVTLAATSTATARARTAPSTVANRVVRLSGNENPYGPGPRARSAIAAAVDDSCRYSGDRYSQLIQALAEHEGVTKEHIVLGAGSGELLHMLALEYVQRGELVCAWPTFAQMIAYAEKLGATVRKIPLDREHRHDLPALSAAVTPNTALVYVCNPNNPTGTTVAAEPLRAFCEQQARATLVVVDEAYLDLIDPGRTASMLDLVRNGANLIVLRTFSKVHGLAGLRIGYGIARPNIIARLKRVQMTFPNTLGMAAALASLGDREFLARTTQQLQADRRRVCASCSALGLEYADPQGNFVFMRVGMPVESFRERMRAEQIEVGRAFEPYSDWCRVSIGTSTETDRFLAALKRVLSVA
jgi:histidinol-phosphate aminotransferase